MKSLIKSLLILISIFTSFSALSYEKHIRDICEDAHYATGYTKLHQYHVTVDWSYISDHGHVELEDVLYGPYFKIIKEIDLNGPLTRYTIKEVGEFDGSYYYSGLNILKRLTLNKIACVYDL